MPKKKENKDDALQQAKLDLLEQGKKAGKLDAKDISAKIPDLPENVEVLDALYMELTEAGVEVVVAEEPAPTDLKALADDWLAEDDEEEVIVEDQTYLDDIADDSVRLYLREIGK